MADMKEIYDQKLGEFKDRKNARAEEQAGLSEAISILYNDDTRDLMKQSFESQGYLFLQNNSMNRKRTAAFKVLGKYVKSKAQLAKITRSLARAGNSIETVITAIEKMLVKLESEGGNDLKKKEQCQADILDNLKEAKRLAVAIDDDLHSITRNDALIEELDGKIKADNETTDKLNEDLKEAKERIEDEEQQMLAAKKDDMAAADAITRAIAALGRFYQKKNAAGFLQRSAQEPSDSQAGAPSLGYEGGYGGLKEENTGVVAMLKMVHGDVEKDIKDGQEIYDASFKEYSEYKSKTEDEIQRLADAITANKETRGNTVEDNEELKGEVSDNRGSLASVQKQITALRQGGCDFMAVNFELRKSNRQAEKDGLQKAKAILEGADFEA
jgi:chromosome segregation ATPase